mmetsp:Transcript_11947/g.28603  ORF Transcript_11947/g.28603 Transcript_11947/m.28603 type:complete len:211 (-) Transcript_11947:1076-1708(-)
MLVDFGNAPADGFGFILLQVKKCILQGFDFVAQFGNQVPIVLFLFLLDWQRGGTGIHHHLLYRLMKIPLSQRCHCFFDCLETTVPAINRRTFFGIIIIALLLGFRLGQRRRNRRRRSHGRRRFGFGRQRFSRKWMMSIGLGQCLYNFGSRRGNSGWDFIIMPLFLDFSSSVLLRGGCCLLWINLRLTHLGILIAYCRSDMVLMICTTAEG